uniref:PCQ3_36 n=1 Tax=Streptomyces sp. W9 TaxID=682410 RepID=D0UZ85_9ACTN|nr:pCQ3_36 [Streptomyces sp. W9]
MTTPTDLAEDAVLQHYRTLPVPERRRVARRASPELRLRLAWVERQIAMDRSPGSLAAILTSGKEMQAPHLDLVDKAFQRIASGERLKVMLTMPPRHGKSRRASRWAPVWYLRRNPDHRLMLASYSATLADDHGRWIRDTITGYADVLGISLNPSSHAANRFDIAGHEGGMVTSGVGGGLTGKGANCFPDNTLVTTEIGKIRIVDLVAMKDRPRVLSFNHATGKTEWRRILATRTSAADELCEVVTRTGVRVRATCDHPIYASGPGYTPAEALRPGDRLLVQAVTVQQDLHHLRGGEEQHRPRASAPRVLHASEVGEGLSALRLVQRGLPQASLRVQQGAQTGPLHLLLLQGPLSGAPCSQKRQAVRSVPRANARTVDAQVLLDAVPHRLAGAPREGVHGVWSILPPEEQQDCILHASLCRQGSLGPHAGVQQSALQGRDQLQQVVPGDATPHIRARQGLVRGLLEAVQADHVQAQRGTYAEVEPDRAPRGRGPEEQPGGEPRPALRQLSPCAPQVDGDAVSVVRRVRAPGIRVHDLQVDGNSNFFADGVLVHNCLIVDDPFKGSEDAESQTMRDRVWDWWQSVALTRLEPNGSLVVINTRWNPDDLSGRLLESEGDEWTVLDLPALALADDDPLGRPTGAPLWPDRYNAESLARIRKGVGERVWWALYQQQPRPLEGGVWQWAWITANRISPAALRGIDLSRIVVAIDPSGGAGGANDETGIVAAGRTVDGQYYVLEDRSGRHGANAWGREACLRAVELRADAFVVETNFGGDMTRQVLIQAWQELERQDATAGMPMPRIVEVVAKQGKRLRAEPIAQLYEQGLVHHVGEWPALETQMVTWLPGMDSPDRMDAAVHALTELADPASTGLGTVAYQDQRLRGRR